MTESNSLFKRSVLLAEEIKFYQENGYLILGRMLTDTGVRMMLQECMKVWGEEKESFDSAASWLTNALLPNIHHKSSIVREFYFNGPIVDIMEQLIGPNIKGVTSQLTFKMRGNTKPFGWHQDNGYGELSPYNSISTLTALEKVDPSNGCLRLIPGSHKQGQIPLEINQGNAIDLDIDDSLAIPMPLKAGESLIFDCATLHQSQGNFSETRDRRILFMRYADADAVEVYNDNKPRLGKLLRGQTRFEEVRKFERNI